MNKKNIIKVSKKKFNRQQLSSIDEEIKAIEDSRVGEWIKIKTIKKANKTEEKKQKRQ